MLWVFRGHNGAHGVVAQLSDVSTFGSEALTAMLHEIRTAGALVSEDDDVRSRALELCTSLVEQALGELGDLEDLGDDPDDARKAQVKAAAEILDGVGSQLYFGSGAMQARRSSSNHHPSPAAVRLADEAAPIIALLGQVPLPRLTHHLVEFMEHVLEERPSAALLAIRNIVTAGGQAGGYQLDKMAVDVTARVVERLLSDHRGVLQSDDCLSALREVLDVFVDAGWPDAHRLAYGLEHIFR